MKAIVWIGLTLSIAFTMSACAPTYTWGYAPAIHPKSVTSYIYAIMAKERGDHEEALIYYDKALAYTRSEKVKAERKALAESME